MKKNGFTVTELLVSFVIMTIVTILLFSLTISLQKLSSENYVSSELKVLSANITKMIKDDLLKDVLTNVTSCGENCYQLTYQKAGNKTLSIDLTNKVFTYGTYKKELNETFQFGGNLTLTQESVPGIAAPKYDSILKIIIPLKTNYYDGDFDAIIVHPYHSSSMA